MIRECVKRKLIITTFALIVFFITLTFPKVEEKIENVTISYQSGNTFPIYLLDKDNLVARTTLAMKETSTIDQAKEMINFLTINNAKSAYIPATFEPVIPSNTTLLSIDIQDQVLKVNFSKEFLNVAKGYEEKMIECLVYSLTELENVKGIILYVEGNMLKKIPNTDISLPSLLTRDIGVNKMYNLNSIKNVSKTTTYYIAKENDAIYYVPVTLLENNDKNKIEIVIERLKSNPSLRTNLMSYLNASTELSNYEILEETVYLSFSPLLYEGLANAEMTEVVKYSISLSLKDTLNIKNVIFTEDTTKAE